MRAGHVGLRPLTLRDASRWADLRRENTSWLGEWESSRPPSTSAGGGSGGSGGGKVGYRSLIRDLRRQARRERALPFVITYHGLMVGQLTVTGITRGSAQWAQIGYWIAESHAGRGITPVAVALAGDHCFSALGLHRLEIAIRPENVASLRIVDKLGFSHVGPAPRYLHINGEWRDHLLFALTAEDVPEGMLARLLSRNPGETPPGR